MGVGGAEASGLEQGGQVERVLPGGLVQARLIGPDGSGHPS